MKENHLIPNFLSEFIDDAEDHDPLAGTALARISAFLRIGLHQRAATYSVVPRGES
jgi:hypothetical protein